MIPGMYVLPAAKTPLSKSMNFVDECKAVDIRFIVVWIMSCLVWYGVLFIHHGIYEEGVFKFVMTIPENYPDGDCPVSTILMKNSNVQKKITGAKALGDSVLKANTVFPGHCAYKSAS